MNSAERHAALTNRSPENQKIIIAKLREYAALQPNERELRLQVTELRWYLWPLMNSAPTNRTTRLTDIPLGQRALVASRLREWDDLPPDVQKELLENEATLQYFTELQGRTPAQQEELLKKLNPAQRKKLQAGIDKWNKLGDDQRRNVAGRFNQFFDLTDPERERALKTLSAPERRQIETTLRAFERLPAEEREQCILSFEKFASLSLVQRDQFLKSAERWRNMTPNERQAWRQLVNRLPSMQSPASQPPLPPDPARIAHTAKTTQPIATNGN